MFDLDNSTVLSDSNLALVEELRSLRESTKANKAREEKIREILLAELKNTDLGVTASGAPMLEVERQPRSRIDGNRLQALYPDVWKDCQIESTVNVLRLPDTTDTPAAP